MSKTKINPKQLYEDRNTSDVFTRLVIMGVLRILNKQLMYQQIWHDDPEGKETIQVPFFFDFGGGTSTSERFIQDNYLLWTNDECTDMGLKKMPGDYKPIPYGIVALSSSSLDTGGITNRFIYGRFNRKENGEIRQYISYLYVMPLTYNFNVSMRVDTMNTMWKLEQAFRECFYKNRTFHFNYRGTVVPCRVGFSESLSEEKTAQYKMGEFADSTDIKLSFDIQCETYQPIFDKYSEMPAEHQIRHIAGGVGVNDFASKENGTIHTLTNLSNTILTQDQEILLEWRFFYNITDLCRVKLSYIIEGDDNEHEITTIDNNNFFYWTIPNDIIENPTQLDVVVVNTENSTIQTEPIIKLYPNPEDGIVSKENVKVLNKGLFITEDKQINAIVSYVNKKGVIIDHDIKINLQNGMVDTLNPIDMEDFFYDGDITTKNIKIKIQDDLNPNITSYFCENQDDWITII